MLIITFFSFYCEKNTLSSGKLSFLYCEEKQVYKWQRIAVSFWVTGFPVLYFNTQRADKNKMCNVKFEQVATPQRFEISIFPAFRLISAVSLEK